MMNSMLFLSAFFFGTGIGGMVFAAFTHSLPDFMIALGCASASGVIFCLRAHEVGLDWRTDWSDHDEFDYL